MAHQLHVQKTRGIRCTLSGGGSMFTTVLHLAAIKTPEEVDAEYLRMAREKLAQGYTNAEVLTRVTTWKGKNGKTTTTYEDIVPVTPA